jgi:hypothetical protein
VAESLEAHALDLAAPERREPVGECGGIIVSSSPTRINAGAFTDGATRAESKGWRMRSATGSQE